MNRQMMFLMMSVLLLLAVQPVLAQPVLLYSETVPAGNPRPFLTPAPYQNLGSSMIFRRMGSGVSTLATFPNNETITTFLMGGGIVQGMPTQYGYDFDDGWEALLVSHDEDGTTYNIVNEPGTDVLFHPMYPYPIRYLAELTNRYTPTRSDHPLFIGIEQERNSTQRLFSLYRKDIDDTPWYPVLTIEPYLDGYQFMASHSLDRRNGLLPVLCFREEIVPNQYH